MTNDSNAKNTTNPVKIYQYSLVGPNDIEVYDKVEAKDLEHALKTALKKAKSLSTVLEGEWKVINVTLF